MRMQRVEEALKQSGFGMAIQETFNYGRHQEKHRMLHLFIQVC
jgi:hypothetical protein